MSEFMKTLPIRSFLCVCRFDPEVEGGESLFLDSFHVAEEFRKQFPEQFENLVRIPGTFQKRHFERYMLGCFSLTQIPSSVVCGLVL
jgi:gamma-butyrobetaine dioxygenase